MTSEILLGMPYGEIQLGFAYSDMYLSMLEELFFS